MRHRSPRRVFAGLLGLLLLLAGTLPAAHAQEPTPEPTATAAPAAATPPPIVLGPEIESLLDAFEAGEPVFVSEPMSNLVGPTELEDLNALATELSQRGYPLRVAVISSIPEGFPSLAVFTDELHSHLALDRGILIVATQTGVSARTNRLDVSEIQSLTNQASSVFQDAGYAAGIRTLTQSLVDAIQARQADNARRALAMFFGMLILLLVGLIAFLMLRRNRWQSALRTARDEHQRLVAATDLIESELAGLPRGPTTLEAIQTLEPARRELEAIAAQISAVSRANLVQVIFRTADWEIVLKDALAGLHDVRSTLRRAQEIAARSSPAFRPVPLPGPIQPVAAIGGSLLAFLTADDLQSRLAPYGGPLTACFFCAQPMQANVAGQVEANLGGRWRQLLACENHAALVARGEEPLVRLVDSDSGEIPWFIDPLFVPYRDYDPQYTRGLTLADVEAYVGTLEKGAVVITTDDPRWMEYQAETGGRLATAAESLPEGADYGPTGYPTEADYSYAEPTVYQPANAPAGETGGEATITPQERAAAEFLEPDLRAAFERAVREAEETPAGSEPAAQSGPTVGSGPTPDLPAGFHPDDGVPLGATGADLGPGRSDEPASQADDQPVPRHVEPGTSEAGTAATAPPTGDWQLPEDLAAASTPGDWPAGVVAPETPAPVAAEPVEDDPWMPAGSLDVTAPFETAPATDQPAAGGRLPGTLGETSDADESNVASPGIDDRSLQPPAEVTSEEQAWLPAAELADGWLAPTDAPPAQAAARAPTPPDAWANPTPLDSPATPVAGTAAQGTTADLAPGTGAEETEPNGPEAIAPPVEAPHRGIEDRGAAGEPGRPAGEATERLSRETLTDAPVPPSATTATDSDPWSWDIPAEPAPAGPPAGSEAGAAGIEAGSRQIPDEVNASEATTPAEASSPVKAATPEPATEDSRPDEGDRLAVEITPPATAQQSTDTGAARPPAEAANVVEDNVELPAGDLVLDVSVLEDTEPDVLPGPSAAEARSDATPSAPSVPKRPPPPPPVITDPEALARGRRPGAPEQPPQTPPQPESRD